MLLGQSPKIESSQLAPHKNLVKVVARHAQHDYRNTIPQYAREAFAELDKTVRADGRPIILDSGCGVGESSWQLALQYPDHLIIAIDKSAQRLDKSKNHALASDAVIFLRADLIHFWQLLEQRQWPVEKHYLLYPNPWPKPSHLQRRWHGHPIFPSLLKTSPEFILRTNWQIYAQEFALAVEYLRAERFLVQPLKTAMPITPFERKYQASGHELFELMIRFVQ